MFSWANFQLNVSATKIMLKFLCKHWIHVSFSRESQCLLFFCHLLFITMSYNAYLYLTVFFIIKIIRLNFSMRSYCFLGKDKYSMGITDKTQWTLPQILGIPNSSVTVILRQTINVQVNVFCIYVTIVSH